MSISPTGNLAQERKKIFLVSSIFRQDRRLYASRKASTGELPVLKPNCPNSDTPEICIVLASPLLMSFPSKIVGMQIAAQNLICLCKSRQLSATKKNVPFWQVWNTSNRILGRCWNTSFRTSSRMASGPGGFLFFIWKVAFSISFTDPIRMHRN